MDQFRALTFDPGKPASPPSTLDWQRLISGSVSQLEKYPTAGPGMK